MGSFLQHEWDSWENSHFLGVHCLFQQSDTQIQRYSVSLDYLQFCQHVTLGALEEDKPDHWPPGPSRTVFSDVSKTHEITVGMILLSVETCKENFFSGTFLTIQSKVSSLQDSTMSPQVIQFVALGRHLPFYFYHTGIQGLDTIQFHVLLPLHFSMMHNLSSMDIPQSASDLNIYIIY